MYTENRQEIIYLISDYPNYDLSRTKFITVKLITTDSQPYVVLKSNNDILLSESMIDDLIIVLQRAKTFIT